ncbi:hypothetical protein ACCO45_004688 [Purpureocillium lilacinum]|uniref:Uncharacterized protein n=1 Tax=Purpureocillium lilacinum TaxID=33203 RepID=A0ACC4DTI4_PURLI
MRASGLHSVVAVTGLLGSVSGHHKHGSSCEEVPIVEYQPVAVVCSGSTTASTITRTYNGCAPTSCVVTVSEFPVTAANITTKTVIGTCEGTRTLPVGPGGDTTVIVTETPGCVITKTTKGPKPGTTTLKPSTPGGTTTVIVTKTTCSEPSPESATGTKTRRPSRSSEESTVSPTGSSATSRSSTTASRTTTSRTGTQSTSSSASNTSTNTSNTGTGSTTSTGSSTSATTSSTSTSGSATTSNTQTTSSTTTNNIIPPTTSSSTSTSTTTSATSSSTSTQTTPTTSSSSTSTTTTTQTTPTTSSSSSSTSTTTTETTPTTSSSSTSTTTTTETTPTTTSSTTSTTTTSTTTTTTDTATTTPTTSPTDTPTTTSSTSTSTTTTTSTSPTQTCPDLENGDFGDTTGTLAPWYISDQVTADSSGVVAEGPDGRSGSSFALIPSQTDRAQVYLNQQIPRCGDPRPRSPSPSGFDYQFTGDSEGCSIGAAVNRETTNLVTITDEGVTPGEWQHYEGQPITVQLTYDSLFTLKLMCDSDTPNTPGILITDITIYQYRFVSMIYDTTLLEVDM